MKVHEAYKQIIVVTLSLGDIILLINRRKLDVTLEIVPVEHYDVVIQLDGSAADKLSNLHIMDDPENNDFKVDWPETRSCPA